MQKHSYADEQIGQVDAAITAQLHTPGPWRVSSRTMIHSVGGAYVARVQSGTTINPDAVTANARLIAAAPDLLAVLVEARKWMDGDLVGDAWDKKFIKSVDRAIAKAADGR